jgi:CRISPR/Cas system-associated exonuclease Cas4 (RecB family)
LIFKEINDLPSGGDNGMGGLINYLKIIITEIGSLKSTGQVDKEYAFHFLKFFNRLQEIFVAKDDHQHTSAAPEDAVDIKSFLRLFRQLIRTHKIPFTGEPLKGLQVMGVLETRNLDFKNVFILSLNEGAFPAVGGKGSYIPHTIRKAYKLPTVEHQDAIYSYLFYRTIQRAENVSIFYNSETDVLGQGEMSRYLQQLLFESGLPIDKKILHNPIQPQSIHPIVIRKNESVMESLLKLNEGNTYFKGISPSALNSYMECRLKFYFRHVAKIREPDEVEEELDARVLGNFLHDVMERFYKKIGEKKKSRQIELSDFMDYEESIDALIDEVFIEAYRLDPVKKVKYEGQRLVVREIVKRFAHRIVEMDKAYAPFTMEALEQEGLTFSVSITHPPHRAVIGGKIDRVDRKGDLVRVIDYKTGKDKLNFESVGSLFSREANRNKAAFQTLLYALLYKQNFSTGRATRLVPGLINRMNLFDEGFSFGLKVGKDQVTDVETLLPEFEARLTQLMEELFDPNGTFDQTEDVENCKFCPYTQICYR